MFSSSNLDWIAVFGYLTIAILIMWQVLLKE